MTRGKSLRSLWTKEESSGKITGMSPGADAAEAFPEVEEDFLVKGEDFLVKEEDFQAKEEDFPAKEEDFPVKEEDLEEVETEADMVEEIISETGITMVAEMGDLARIEVSAAEEEELLEEEEDSEEMKEGEAWTELEEESKSDT